MGMQHLVDERKADVTAIFGVKTDMHIQYTSSFDTRANSMQFRNRSNIVDISVVFCLPNRKFKGVTLH